MSVQAISWVLEHSPARGTDRLVLLSLANHAGDEVEPGVYESWPGVETIAREAGLDRRRTAQDALSRLVDAGAIERKVNGAPDRRCRPDRRPNLYRIITASTDAHGVPHTDTPQGQQEEDSGPERGDGSRHPDGMTSGDTPRGERGDAPASNGVTDHDTQTVIEPTEALTSSDTPPDAPVRSDDDDRSDPISSAVTDALVVLARRDLEARNRAVPADPVRAEGPWLGKAQRRRATADQARLEALHGEHPTADGERLADLLEPPVIEPTPLRVVRTEGQDRLRGCLSEEPPDPSVVERGVASSRAALRGRSEAS